MDRYAVTSRTEEGVCVYTLSDTVKQAQAEIIPELGNNCFRFQQTLRGQKIDLIEPAPSIGAIKNRASGFGNPILFPFPNRVREGKYAFEGKSYEFSTKTALGNSIHGFVYTRPWHVESTEASESGAKIVSRFDIADFAGLSSEYPFPFELRIIYTLAEGVLSLEVDVKNTGDGNMPMGFGIHPYFSAPLFPSTDPADCWVQVPANRSWVLDGFLPTGEQIEVSGSNDLRQGLPFKDMKFDDVLTDLSQCPSQCIIDDRANKTRFILASDAQFREMVIYTPPERNAIAIEPYTCTTDAVNLQAKGTDAGLIVLGAGETFHGQIRMWAEEYE